MMIVTITGTHEDGTTITHTIDTRDYIHDTAWTIELMRYCGYTEIEIRKN
jgi:hypothetical protein